MAEKSRLTHPRNSPKKRVSARLGLFPLLAVILAACGTPAASAPTPDVAVIQTEAAHLVATQFAMGQTQTALAAPPSPLPSFTPLPTFTLRPATTPGVTSGTPFVFNTPSGLTTPFATVSTANGCNDGAYVGETAPLDKAVVKGGEEFSKAWTIDNTGTCTWGEGYVFSYQAALSSPQLIGRDIVIKADPEEHTAPGHGQTFVVKLTPPIAAGEYKAYYKLRDPSGNYFGPMVYVWVVVE